MKRKATAVWNGTGKTGNGHLTTQSNVLSKTQYNYTSRFEEGIGTNPEELVAAAHAGCFCMKINFIMNAAGVTADEVTTTCTVTLENGSITASHLEVTAKVPGVTREQMAVWVEEAEKNCPISKSLTATITSEFTLV